MTVSHIVIIVALVLEGIAIWLFLLHYNRFKLIFNTKTSLASTIRKGYYEMKGKVVDLGEILTSPLSKKPCVYYKFKVEQKRGGGKNSSWHTIINDKQMCRFAIEDRTGKAILTPFGAKMKLSKDYKSNSNFFNSATPEMESALAKYGKRTKTWIFQRNTRYEETYIEKGDELYVIGKVDEHEGNIPVFSESKQPYIISDKSEQQLLNIYKTSYIVAGFFIILIPIAAYFVITNLNMPLG